MIRKNGMRVRRGTFRTYEAEEVPSDAIDDNEVQKDIKNVAKALKTNNLEQYVGVLNDLMGDKKGRFALQLFSGTIPEDKLEEMGLAHVQFDLRDRAYNVTSLVPTQKEIGFTKSLANAISDSRGSLKDMIKGDDVVLGIPIITCNGHFIIDGHHRWSQVTCVNPNATMKALDLVITSGDGHLNFAKSSMALKVVQALIASIALDKGMDKLPSAAVKGLDNIYDMDADRLFNSIKDFDGSHAGLEKLSKEKVIQDGSFKGGVANVEKYILDAAKGIKDADVKPVKDGGMEAWKELDDETKAVLYLTGNCKGLPRNPEAPERKWMPQTDGAGMVDIKMTDIGDAAKSGLNVQEKLRKTLRDVRRSLENRTRVSLEDRRYLERHGYCIKDGTIKRVR